MAITKLTRIKEAKRGNPSSALKANLKYICNDSKTGGGVWVGGNAGGSPEIAYRTMADNKEIWGKIGGTQAFHYILSFPPDCGIDEATAFKIAKEFCEALLGDDYYYLFAVHNDKDHMHVHITFDSVSKRDGLKFHSPQGDWYNRIQPITDELCKKYHLPTLDYDPDEKRGRNYGDWKKKYMPEEDKETYYTWNDIVRDDIDEAIQHSDNYDEFINYLKNEGYEITRNQKVLSVRPKGRERAIRTARLGDGYAKEEIIERINDKQLSGNIEERYKTYGNREEMRDIIYAKIFTVKDWHMSPMQKQFWHRWNNTYFIRKPEFMTPEQRQRNKESILEIRKMSDSMQYLIDHDIRTPEELGLKQSELVSEKDALTRELNSSRTKLNFKRPNSDVAKYLKLKGRADKEQTPDPETTKQMNELAKKIETVCPLGEAVSTYQDMKDHISDIRGLIKDNKKEAGIVEDTFRFYFNMEPEEIRSQNQSKSEPETEPQRESQQEDKPQRQDAKPEEGKTESPSNKGANFNKPDREDKGMAGKEEAREGATKITINEKLFVNVKEGFDCETRIPYKKTHIIIPKEDWSLSDDGSTLTAWIYDDKEYRVASFSSNTQEQESKDETIKGKDLKTNYEDKTTRKEKVNDAEHESR